MSKRYNKQVTDLLAKIPDYVNGAMLAAITGIMPLIVRFATRPMPPESIGLQGVTEMHDAFVYWKAWGLAIPLAAMVLYFIFDYYITGKTVDVRKALLKVPIVLAISYFFLVIVSAIFSNYTHTAWLGTFQREEGALIWFAYMLAFAFALYYVRSLNHAKPILWGLCFSSILMGIMGFSQLIGRDLFYNPIVSWMVTVGTEVLRFATVFDIAHGTLFNPNTFGKYTAMVAPILLVAGICYKGKLWEKGLLLLGGVLMFIGIFASSSLGGLMGVIAATAALVVTFAARVIYGAIKKNGTVSPAVLGRVAAGFCAVTLVTMLALLFVPVLNQRVTTLFNRLREAAAAETTGADRFSFAGNTMYLDGANGRIFSLTVHPMNHAIDEWKTVSDAHGNTMEWVDHMPGNTALGHPDLYAYDIPGAGILQIDRFGNEFVVVLHDIGIPFLLAYNAGNLYALQHWRDTMHPLPVPAWGFEGREAWGSGRGYIWSRTFPMMPRTAIIGTGPDTFVNVFPNHDTAGNLVTFPRPTNVDKAHNLFLQTWITTGGISALLLFGLFGHYLIITFWSLVKSKGEELFSFGLRLGLLSGVAGFAMASMATDSTIGSTGVFFVLLGMGYGLNYYHNATHNKTQNAPKPNN